MACNHSSQRKVMFSVMCVCHSFTEGVPISVADLREGARDAPPPRGPKFFEFHAVFGKIWQNRMLAPPLGSWRPLLGEILNPPLHIMTWPCPPHPWQWLSPFTINRPPSKTCSNLFNLIWYNIQEPPVLTNIFKLVQLGPHHTGTPKDMLKPVHYIACTSVGNQTLTT